VPVSSVAISVEGVLSRPFSASPVPLGIALYHSLKENFNILLYSDQDRNTLDHWLSVEALNIQVATEYNESSRQWLTDPERKLTQLNSLRQRGYKIDLVLEPNPEAAALMLINGFNILNFIHSQYAMPQWRPDFTGTGRSWDILSGMADRMAELKALDKRLKDLNEDQDWR